TRCREPPGLRCCRTPRTGQPLESAPRRNENGPPEATGRYLPPPFQPEVRSQSRTSTFPFSDTHTHEILDLCSRVYTNKYVLTYKLAIFYHANSRSGFARGRITRRGRAVEHAPISIAHRKPGARKLAVGSSRHYIDSGYSSLARSSRRMSGIAPGRWPS